MIDSYRRRTVVVLLAALAALVAAGLGGLAAHDSPSAFRSTALVSVDEPQAVAASRDGGVLEKLSRVRLKYLGLVETDLIATPVASRLSVPVDQVRGRLSATALPADLLLRVTCTGGSQGQVRRCADALAGALVSYADQEQASYRIPDDQKIVLTQVQPAGAAGREQDDRRRTFAVAGLAGALAAAVVLAVAARQS